MRILMLTNTYPPVVSGVARSIVAFDEQFRRLGHDVRIIAPEADREMKEDADHVLRVPAIQHFNGSEFPVPMPSPGLVAATMDEFQPDIVHAHHPFFMGNTALRLAKSRQVPLVFTHHTMYDQYTHYAAGGGSSGLVRFVGALTAGYAQLCDAVIAPSQAVADLLHERGVTTRLEVIPTGVNTAKFARGDGGAFRRRQRIPEDVLLIGYVGRLAPEKNLLFLAKSVAEFLASDATAHQVVVGSGPCDEDFRSTFEAVHLSDRLHLAGCCTGQDLIDAYHALDVFAFASHSETQGMVVTEAMAAGKPVVALDGPGVRDVIRDRINGRLIDAEDHQSFAGALRWIVARDAQGRAAIAAAARQTAENLSMERQAKKVLRLYESLQQEMAGEEEPGTAWNRAKKRVEAELSLWSNLAQAATSAIEPALAGEHASGA